MIEYRLADDEQRLMAENARKMVQELLEPEIHDLELADEGQGMYPMNIHQALAEAGYSGLNIPEEWGGLEMSPITQAVIYEEMSNIDAGFSLSFYNAGAHFPLILKSALSKEEKQGLADGILSGEEIGCFCFAEADADASLVDMETVAVKDGDSWVINGSKCFVTNGPLATHFIVGAWTDKSKPANQGITFFFVEKKRGVEIGRKENKMGLKLSETAEVIFEDVRVPEDHVLGEVGQGLSAVMPFVSGEMQIIGSVCNLGLAQAAIDHAVNYSRERVQFGKRICDHEGLGFMLAEMQSRTDASRALIYQTLEYMDARHDVGRLNAVIKMFVSENTMQTALDAVQVFGGYGYMKDFPVEKYMRDAKVFCIYGGTSQVQKQNILRSLVG